MRQDGKLKELLLRSEKMGVPAIDCIVFRKGKCIFRHQSGYSDEARTKPVDGSERYNIYSCSKLITCVAALQLVEQGKLGLDDPVYEYLPEFRHLQKKCGEGADPVAASLIVQNLFAMQGNLAHNAAAPNQPDSLPKQGDDRLEPVTTTMTVRHLFTMTAGLTYNVASPNLLRGMAETKGRLPTREAMKYLAKDPLIFEPGENWCYSLCHDVLAAIVEVVSGQRFGSFVKARIFDPLGMSQSTFLLPEEELGSITAQYRYHEDTKAFVPCGPEVQLCKLGTEYESGGGGCISTVDEYIRFLEAMRTGEQLLKRETIAEMTRPQISGEAQRVFERPGYSYGLGVRCPKPGFGTHDYGWGGAAGAFLAIIPDAETTLFHVQHVLSSPNRSLRMSFVAALLDDLQG